MFQSLERSHEVGQSLNQEILEDPPLSAPKSHKNASTMFLTC
jgi:hypothetical protein